MPNGTVTVAGVTYTWTTSGNGVTQASSKLKKALREAEVSFFQKAVDYIGEAGSPKSKPADSAIGRCDKQPGVGHLAWQIGKASMGDLKFDAVSALRISTCGANMADILSQLFVISTEQGLDLTIT